MNDESLSQKPSLAKLVNLFGPFLGLVLVLGLFALSPVLREYLFTTKNFKLIFLQTIIVAIAALGMTLIIVSGGIDLSAGSVVALCSVVAAILIRANHSAPVAVIAAIFTGGFVGLISGSIIAGFRMVPFIVTLGMMGIARGAAKWLANSQTVIPPDNPLNDIMDPLHPVLYYPVAAQWGLGICGVLILVTGLLWLLLFAAKIFRMNRIHEATIPHAGRKISSMLPKFLIISATGFIVSLASLMQFPVGVWIAIALALAMIVIMRQTVFGRYAFAIGSNEDTARLCGIRVRLNKLVIYMIGGMFFGLAGLMQFSRLTLGDPTAGIGMELDIIAAVVIGGASLSGGVGSILGSMIGALIMAILRNGTNQLGWQTYTQEIIIGVVIILAVGIDKLRQRKHA